MARMPGLVAARGWVPGLDGVRGGGVLGGAGLRASLIGGGV
ncbi:hypothetical protein [Corallococcus sp. AB011P]|nr:hypothetical protein [Corallococcus sp. AB011P]